MELFGLDGLATDPAYVNIRKRCSNSSQLRVRGSIPVTNVCNGILPGFVIKRGKTTLVIDSTSTPFCTAGTSGLLEIKWEDAKTSL